MTYLKVARFFKLISYSLLLHLEVLQKVTSRIVNEVKGVVLYDCTGKPPATIVYDCLRYKTIAL